MNGEQEIKPEIPKTTEPKPQTPEPQTPTVGINEALAQNPEQDEKISTVRTFQSDIAGAVKTDNISMIKIAMAEKERRERENQFINLQQKNKIKPAYIFAGIIILIIASALGYLYWYLNKPAGPTLEQIIAPNEPEIIYSETQSAVSIDNKTSKILIEDLRRDALAKLDLGTMKRILVTTGTGSSTRNINTEEFLNTIKSRSSDSLKRSLESYFVIGAYSFEPHDIFIIFKINTYDIAYPGMLAWEPSMDSDLSDLFVEKKAVEVIPTPTVMATTSQEEANNSTSTIDISDEEEQPIETKVVSTTPVKTTSDADKPVWKDRILQNKDTRVLVDKDGNIKFLYSFIDKNTLVIVSSEKGFKEVITRMTTGRVKR